MLQEPQKRQSKDSVVLTPPTLIPPTLTPPESLAPVLAPPTEVARPTFIDEIPIDDLLIAMRLSNQDAQRRSEARIKLVQLLRKYVVSKDTLKQIVVECQQQLKKTNILTVDAEHELFLLIGICCYYLDIYEKSKHYLSMITASHQDVAMNYIGNMYFFGRGVGRNYATATSWYRRAADAGDVYAMRNYGIMFHTGRGITKDEGSALYWWRKAAEHGDLISMSILGRRYQYGEGVIKDIRAAFSWYLKAADVGCAVGWCNLGRLHEYGIGVAQNKTKAAHYYRNAKLLAKRQRIDDEDKKLIDEALSDIESIPEVRYYRLTLKQPLPINEIITLAIDEKSSDVLTLFFLDDKVTFHDKLKLALNLSADDLHQQPHHILPIITLLIEEIHEVLSVPPFVFDRENETLKTAWLSLKLCGVQAVDALESSMQITRNENKKLNLFEQLQQVYVHLLNSKSTLECLASYVSTPGDTRKLKNLQQDCELLKKQTEYSVLEQFVRIKDRIQIFSPKGLTLGLTVPRPETPLAQLRESLQGWLKQVRGYAAQCERGAAPVVVPPGLKSPV
jgi:hypothetical protein